jgi:starvation-inducible DNA-binding protein
MTPEIKLKAKQAFADSFIFYLQAHYYHWNVEGRHFSQDHELFGKIYEEVQDNLDKFAEEIRTIGTYAPGIFDRFMDLSSIQQSSDIPSAEEMYQTLIEKNARVIESLTELFEMLEGNRLHGFGDFIAGRIDAHNKHQWMLTSTLK